MPTYTFRSNKDGSEWDDTMSHTTLDLYYLKHDCVQIFYTAPMVLSGSGDNIDAKTDDGWKETLAKISEAHPDSELNKQYGQRKRAKDIKTEEVRKKHKTIAERRINKIIQSK